MLSVAYQNGERDVRLTGTEVNLNNIQGASVPYLNQAVISDDVRFVYGEKIGRPTERISPGSHISCYQKQRRGPTGRCHWNLEESRERARANANEKGSGKKAATNEKGSGKKSTPKKKSASFDKRCVQTILNDGNASEAGMRRKRRLLTKLASDGQNAEKVIMNSYDQGGETPDQGKSQEAVTNMLQFQSPGE
ncbi:hypothetical protein ACHAWF_016028 [Thalassiosira exigua]